MKKQTDSALLLFLGKHYATYKRACISLHAGCMGNSIRIGSDVDHSVVDTAPTLCGQSTPLVFAATSLIYIVGTLCVNFNIDYKRHVTALNQLLINYQNQEEKDIKGDA